MHPVQKLVTVAHAGAFEDERELLEWLTANVEDVSSHPEAATQPFRTLPPAHYNVKWAITNKSYSVLTFLLAFGWDINHPDTVFDYHSCSMLG